MRPSSCDEPEARLVGSSCPLRRLKRLVGLAMQLEVVVLALVLRGALCVGLVVAAMQLEVLVLALVLRGVLGVGLVVAAMRLDVLLLLSALVLLFHRNPPCRRGREAVP